MTLEEWTGYLNDVPLGWVMREENDCGTIQRSINDIPVIITDDIDEL